MSSVVEAFAVLVSVSLKQSSSLWVATVDSVLRAIGRGGQRKTTSAFASAFLASIYTQKIYFILSEELLVNEFIM